MNRREFLSSAMGSVAGVVTGGCGRERAWH